MNAPCTENWNAMHPVTDGRFCDKCQQRVVDLTRWERRAVLSFKQANPQACGLYLTEHLEPDLIPLVDLLMLKRSTLAAGLVLGSINVVGQHQGAFPAVELVAQGHSASREMGNRVSAPLHGPSKEDAPDAIATKHPPMAKEIDSRWPRIYFSKRFPFLHIRKRYVMGRMLHTL